MYIDDSKLIKLCIAGAVIGIVILYLFAGTITSNPVKLGEINSNNVGNIVSVSGQVSGLSESSGNMFFTLKDYTGEVKVVIWSDTLEELELSGFDVKEIKNDVKLGIVGTVEIYKGGLELIPLRSQIKIL